ncbi:response regulator [Cytophagaceae bacterium DM2B3-1]|uniref:Response regulator n=1 Tax=Xanthocytophaga flava TaxID=3048013 RepID=A0ABT7CLA1_9BACT|nr:response regulator [Xanthocytophaga flavus]MDJ1494524.1 response regulator [Xanthocytophaga flavus]
MLDEIFFLLIAEDDADDREIVKFVIKQNFPDWQYYIATNGQALLDYLSNRPPGLPLISLIMLDINMPIKNGIETVDELRTIPLYKDIITVGFSTSDQDWVKNEFIEAGGDEFFQKPNEIVQYEKILSLLPEMVSSARKMNR